MFCSVKCASLTNALIICLTGMCGSFMYITWVIESSGNSSGNSSRNSPWDPWKELGRVLY